MDVDRVLLTFNEQQVAYLLVGGVNFLLQHEPVLTYDVDLWVESSAANRARCEAALAALDAEWGKTEESWTRVSDLPTGWLDGAQSVYCLASPAGAIDVFLELKGLGTWPDSHSTSVEVRTATGTVCRGLNDDDMLACQMALESGERKQGRVDYFRRRKGNKSLP